VHKGSFSGVSTTGKEHKAELEGQYEGPFERGSRPNPVASDQEIVNLITDPAYTGDILSVFQNGDGSR
jgi:hypothetical protein